ncbi:polysaccharide biosynthesis/export family protein [Methylobrevis pamukkalensis]|uniref:Polysaccharide biosynthesis/export protein n=1 Tax=Methylobrevis pamukkalensis TaxID=1439726 RepID=A0A1E3H740_9HYPH|nr:polysaccharide biosynthesis/export family protein [Methylobrevis pamukkalensis]ODN71321.1 Polysaccharide biosynthesis/export protein [Methylobrevis pamukkalensis]
MHFRATVVLTAGLALSACSNLPAEGPSASAIHEDAGKQLPALSAYELVDITPQSLAALQGRTNETFAGNFGGKGGGSIGRIGIGDTVAVTIWEAGTGGLFSGGGQVSAAAAGANSATIPPQMVGSDGAIVVPYAGVVTASGRTTQQVRADIERSLAGKAIEPQVLVNVVKSVGNTVTVTGEVTRGGRIPLSPSGDRLLDVVAEAGGVSVPAHQAFVTLTRRSVTARVPMQKIIDNPRENVLVSAGDVIAISQKTQTFTVFGAAGTHADIPFTSQEMMLSEAIAKAGGLLDNRADPAGVFIYRMEQRTILSRLKPDSQVLASNYGETVPVIYRLDLRAPAGLFMAKQFQVYDKDTIYVANAKLSEIQKFLTLVGTLTQPASTGISLVNAAGN